MSPRLQLLLNGPLVSPNAGSAFPFALGYLQCTLEDPCLGWKQERQMYSHSSSNTGIPVKLLQILSNGTDFLLTGGDWVQPGMLFH